MSECLNCDVSDAEIKKLRQERDEGGIMGKMHELRKKVEHQGILISKLHKNESALRNELDELRALLAEALVPVMEQGDVRDWERRIREALEKD